MGKELNQWLRNAIKAKDFMRLDEFQKKLKGGRLVDVLDRKSIFYMASWWGPDLKTAEQRYPGILARIDFQMALQTRNVYALEANKDIYFADEAWKNTVSRILFLKYDQSLTYSAICKYGFAEELFLVLDWIHKYVGELPKIDGMDELCSVADLSGFLSYYHEPAFNSNQRGEFVRLRQLCGGKNMIINCDDKIKKESSVYDFSKYSEIELIKRDKEDEISAKSFVTALCYILENNYPEDNIVISDLDNLCEEFVLEELAGAIEYNDKLQGQVVLLYRRYNKLKELYGTINETRVSNGAYAGIMQEYYREEWKNEY